MSDEVKKKATGKQAKSPAAKPVKRVKKGGEPNAPWLKFYENCPAHLDYPNATIYEMVEASAERTPDFPAYEFQGTTRSFKAFVEEIATCARALKQLGIEENDVVTVCLPNIPQAIIMFYALNRIGALPSMVHPLSASGEIEFFLNVSQSVAAITLDAFYPKFEAIKHKTGVKKLIIASIKDFLNPVMALGFQLTKGRKIAKVPESDEIISWKEFIADGARYNGPTRAKKDAADAAAILYSGGTTGTTKGILLSNANFNALTKQACTFAGAKEGEVILSIMPVFHGFGLGIGINMALANSMKCVLIPQFSPKTYGNIIKKNKPNYIAGVPTLFEGMIVNDALQNADLSFLKGIFCGGDSLSIELKRKVDKFLTEHNCSEQIREGYGATECVTASAITPRYVNKEGSFGVPLPDTYYKIVEPGTTKEVPVGTDGEICISGPSVMMGYINRKEENAHTLQVHPDGRTWLHTGDLGCMDVNGFFFFKQRIKRMIITSGYNVYPSQLENIIEGHQAVLSSCVIGVPDPYKMQKVKAFVVLRPEYAAMPDQETLKADIVKYCRENIAKYAFPYEFEYRSELPRTLVGKVAYTVLEKEESEKQKNLQAECEKK